MPRCPAGALLLACALAAALPASADAAAKTMRFRVLNATSFPLTVQDRTLEKGHWRNAGPVGAEPLHVADFTMESESLKAKGDIRWRIGTSNYLLKVWGNVDGPASNCAIQDLNRKDVSNSPYTCTERHTNKADSDQFTVVQPKAETTATLDSGQQRRAVYENLCGTGVAGTTGYATCEVTPRHQGTGPGRFEPAGDILVNCGPDKFDGDIGWSHTYGQTNTVGGSIGLEYESPLKAFQTKLEATFEINWTTSRTDTRTTTIGVPAGHFGWIDAAPLEQTVEAAVKATAGNQTFILPDVNMGAPLAKGAAGTYNADGGTLPAGYCDGTSRVALTREQPATGPDPAQVYVLGLRSFNQRVMSAPGDTQAADVGIDLGQYEERPGQRWLLEPAGDGRYQIRSDNNLDLCLDQWVAGERILQHPCKPGANNQLWSLVYDAGRTSFQLKSVINDKLIGVRSSDAGAGLIAVTGAPAGVHTFWELNHA